MIQIILVDDEPLALEHLNRLIEKKEGYQVIGEYTDAEQAMQAAGNRKPDIIVTDICMDGLDGLAMVEQMKNVWGKEIVFVAVSGYQEFHYAKKALELGVRDYLLKPVTARELFAVLDKIKAEIESEKRRNEIIEKTEEPKECPTVVISGLLEELAEEVLKLHMESVEVLLEELLGDVSEERAGHDIQERQLSLLFRLLDEKLEHKNGELQSFWQRRREKDGLSMENVRKCICQSMLQIMEEKEVCVEQPVLYMQLFIQEHYKEDILLQTFAERFYMNKAYLGQKFKNETGVSVNDYLQRRRIQEAVKLANTTELSWQEISFRVGYGNYISFLKYFTKQEGILPSDYPR